MKIYTSYFANLKKISKELIPIAICGKSPEWYKGIEYKKLAPKYDFFMEWKQSSAPNKNEIYTKQFGKQVLDKLSIENVLKDLSEKSNGKDVVLLCYEKPSDFCHRHLVCEWLNDNGVECSEYVGGSIIG